MTTSTSTTTDVELIDVDTPEVRLRTMLGVIELDVTTSYTLADAIREGSGVSTQAYGWGSGDSACALSAAAIAARVRGYLK